MQAFLRLCRLPTLFTALSNIVAGFLLSHSSLAPLSDFLLLLGSSTGLYLAGMVFNDVFDVEQDRQERPGRPIPSGQVPWKAAVVFGTVLMTIGLGCAALACWVSLVIAGALAVSILLYDAIMKRTLLGPLFMGLCRTLNLLLGASSVSERLAGPFQQPLLWYAACIGIYIVGVTLFAKREAKENTRFPLFASLVVIDVGLLGVAFWLATLPPHFGFPIPPGALTDSMPILILWGVVFLTINRRVIAAIADPVPAKIQPAVGLMLLSLIVLDAMVIYFKGGTDAIPYAIATVALIAPAIVLRKFIPMT